jgi:dienelactone hydrolase
MIIRSWRRLPVAAAMVALAALLLASCAAPTQPPMPPEAAPVAMDCPAEVPAGARCLRGQDSAGAFYVIVIPAQWSGVLVLHAHGGPTLGPVSFDRALADLKRWGVWVEAGHAFAASTFRQGGVEVRAAAQDTERLRGIFVQHVAKPKRTILHGQSWGAGVAAKGAEMFTAGKPYDAVLLTSGVLAGGTRAYDFRLDLRVIYQYLCQNHPRPDEDQYPLWMGLPKGAKFNAAQLRERTKACLGLGLPAAQRTPEQARKLKTIVDVLKIRENSVQGHLNWATQHFADIAHERTGGRPVFGNIGAVYQGSSDDAALNAGVQRYRTDPVAVAQFAADTDPNGRIPVPVLTVHAVGDPTAFVEMEHQFRKTMEAAGTADRLVQVFTDDHEHSFLSAPVYPAAAEALLQWVETGRKPTPQTIAQRCGELQASFGPGCRLLPAYQPAPLDTRITPRSRP